MVAKQVLYQTTVLGKALEFPEAAPPQLRELGERCLHMDPQQRPSFQQIMQELNVL